MKGLHLLVVLCLLLGLTACQTAGESAGGALKVLAVESFLADLTQQVAGDRLTVDTLIPSGLDPHAFEPTPRDLAKVAESRVIILNGGGLEEWLEGAIENAGGEHRVIVASEGLAFRAPGAKEEAQGTPEDGHAEGDPHFWLDPLNAIRYIENIRDGLIEADPEGEAVYTQNADAYIAQLRELDRWINEQVETIPPVNRLLVTNHESFGYFADRYGFKVVGAVIPSVSSGASPSAQSMGQLIEAVRAAHAPAIFLETGSNPDLAQEIAAETGAQVVTDLYTHSLSGSEGEAGSYIEMMRHNTMRIVEALTGKR